MSRPLLLPLVVCLLFSAQTFAQRKVDKNGHFKRIYPVANEQLEAGRAARAVKNFLDLHELDPKNAHINYKVGRSYLLLNGEKQEAVGYLEKSVVHTDARARNSYKEKNAPIDAYFYLARAYHLDSQFDNAIAAYRKYAKVAGGIGKEKKEEIVLAVPTQKSVVGLSALAFCSYFTKELKQNFNR